MNIRIKYSFLIVFLSVLTKFCVADHKTDSLTSAFSSATSDTSRVDILLDLYSNVENVDPAKASDYLNQANIIAHTSGDKSYIAKVTNQLGTMYFFSGDYEKAIKYFLETMDAYGGLKNNVGISNCLNNIGSVYVQQENFNKALEYHQKALQIRLENVEKGVGDNDAVAMSYGNIGQAYYYLNDFNKAMESYNRSLKMSEEMGNKNRIALMLNNIGSIFAEQKLYDNALNYFNRALVIHQENEDPQRSAMALNNIAEVYFMQKKYPQAIETYEKGLITSKEVGDLDDLKTSYDGLHSCYLNMNDYKKAHEYLLLYNGIKDSIYNTENAAQINEMLTKFDTNKKQQEIEILQKNEEIQSFWRNSLIVGLLLVFLLVLVLFNRNKVKQRANNALSEKNRDIEQQKSVIELKSTQLGIKNKEITDSIKYAKHLQLAILPPDNHIARLLPQNFVLYKPKDIVSGDFYYVEEWGSQVLVAAADCTGHGVPGAFMSIVGNNLLQQAVNVYGLSKPFLILNSLNKNISKILRQSEETATVRDGMDIALLSYDKGKGVVEFAGAYNPLWMIRGKELIEFKADKQPIGAFIGEELKPFTHHEFKVQSGDMLYVFTDGYADQFGGVKGKKFKYKQLQDLFIAISDKEMQEQKDILNERIESWKGDLEQVDDILIVGIRI